MSEFHRKKTWKKFQVQVAFPNISNFSFSYRKNNADCLALIPYQRDVIKMSLNLMYATNLYGKKRTSGATKHHYITLVGPMHTAE